jgi:type IV pilus assembly protein PilO
MNLSSINWDIESSGTWPAPVKATIIALLCLVSAGLWYYFDTQQQLVDLQNQEAKETKLKEEFEQKYRKAVNLQEYKEQMDEMEKTFGDLLRQLPDKTEVPDLLVDVSQTGLASGLEFELFKPGAEIPREFYAELPIEIKVIGNFAEFGAFVSGLASLPRIVTIHNIKILPNTTKKAERGDKGMLAMSATVKTYRYLDEGSIPAPPPGGKKPQKPPQKKPQPAKKP